MKEELQSRIRNLVEDLGIQWKPDTQGLLHPLNPNRKDNRPGSLVIWTDPGRIGAWKDYASNDQGDIFGMIQFWARPRPAGKMDVYWWALEWLGWDRGTVRTLAEDVEARERREREARAEASRQDALAAAKARALKGLWLGLPPIAGTPAEFYLREVRRLPLERLKHQPGALRWADHVEWTDPETGEVFEWRNVMCSAMTKGPELVALHRTWLKPDGSGPDPVRKANGRHKTMIGAAAGAAIRLSSGPSNLSPGAAAKRGVTGPLAIGEGIETSEAVAIARSDYRVWAAGSLSLMGLLEWPECASAVVLLRDNDWDKPEAVKAFERVEAHWRAMAKGRPVQVVAPPPGVDDFNSWAMGAAA
ncbi:DUF7146 domain-containing protein [Brevundimonas staleyi]|uniref:DUF7146 domain-containing protein n=1 Tax=Brevundimonas staleyi TaxID=74326 RepID=UPI00366C7BE5